MLPSLKLSQMLVDLILYKCRYKFINEVLLLKTYSRNSMPDMEDMYEMPHMMATQGICPMMNMQGMCPMMQMYGMCPMMNMQGMNPMMGMQGMNPMMDTQSMYRMNDMVDDDRQFPIPMLAKLEQISPNKIQISYDRDVDMMKGMNPNNYWVQDTINFMPQGIATLGRRDNVNVGNSLTSNLVKIEPKDGSSKTFIITFNQVIPRGAEYKLIICYVTVKGAPPYSGDNGMATFIGK